MKNQTEKALYPHIQRWFEQYLKEKYKKSTIITTYRTSSHSLEPILRDHKVSIPEATGLAVKIDIVGIIKQRNEIGLVFIEVKDNPLTLVDLGQLWGYTQLLNPLESFLVSSKGLGSLNYILNVLKREDLLIYGLKKERRMHVCKWDESANSIDYPSVIPKI